MQYGGKKLFGRRKIFTDYSRITPENVIKALNEAMAVHTKNANEINYLMNYYRGKQPILNRSKTVRPDITYNTVVNRASEIVSFKVSYLLSEPIVYVARHNDAELVNKLGKLNDFMHLADKQARDKELADDFSICGVAYRYVYRNNDYDADEKPFIIQTLNPATTFVAYERSSYKDSAPVFAVTYVERRNGSKYFDLFTSDSHYTIDGKSVSVEPNFIGNIPIIEYVNNEFRLGAFEQVIGLLDGANALESNRIEATEQNVQSLLWFNDVQFEEEELEKLRTNPSAFVFTKSVQGSVKPDIKNIVVQLQQADQQVLMNDLYKDILTIVGMPSVGDGNTSDSSNNGSTIVRNGWQHAEARAKDTDTLWNRSDKRFLAAALQICSMKGKLELRPTDIIGKFTRRNYEDLMTKTTVLTTLLGSDKVAPHIAYQVANLVPDPEEAYKEGMKWMDEQKKKAEIELKQTQKLSEGNEQNHDEGEQA